jgi:tetratricopeptide (TPR) repeat protein
VADTSDVSDRGALDDELARYEAVIDRHQADTGPASQAQVAWALASTGWALSQHSRPDEALDAFDKVIQRYGQAVETEIREQVACSLLWKGAVLRQLHRREAAAAAYGALLKHFPEGESAGIDAYLAVAQERLQKIAHPSPWR